MRPDLIEVVEDAGTGLNCEFSTVVRAGLDLIAPPADGGLLAQYEAALALGWRRLQSRFSALEPLVRTGWAGGVVAIPIDTPRREEAAVLVEAVVGMLRRVRPLAPGEDPAAGPPGGWAASVPGEVLHVLSSPGVRVITSEGGRPTRFLAATVMCPGDPGAGERPAAPERQYEVPREALAKLLSGPASLARDVTRRYRDLLGTVLRGRAYELNWKRIDARGAGWSPAAPE